MAMAEAQKSNSRKYVVVYFCILGIAALQFVFAYSHASASEMLIRMLVLAAIEALLAMLYFMHLEENRGLKWFVLIFTAAAVFGMQYGWTDSFRLLSGAPWAK